MEETEQDRKGNKGSPSKAGELENEETQPKGSLRMVLKQSDRTDMLLMVLGTIGCVADGSSMAIIMLVLSKLMNGYASTSLSSADIDKYALALVYVAIAVGSGAFLEGFCWARTAERQTSRIRTTYLHTVLRQDVGFFDTIHGASITSQVVSSISTDMLTIQGVLSEKIPNFITNIAMFLTGQLASLYLCWRLAIIGIPGLLMLIIPGIVYGMLLSKIGEEIQKAYAAAAGTVEQAISSIRTVYSYVGEEKMIKNFSTALGPTLKLGIKQGLMKGMAIGSIGVVFAVWALQSWYGSILVTKNGVKGGDAFTAGTCIVYGGLALGGALINVKYIAEANIAAEAIFGMIDRVPVIDYANQQGDTISGFKGELEFKDIDFAYPSRPENLILRKFNLKVMACQTIGLVGGSGSGKSTVINLLERFYDPLEGEIFLDGVSIRGLELKWLRSQMGLVSQDPILFATSIKQNILFGKCEASLDEIVQAAKAANVHNFIIQLPNGYDTHVGELGMQMSEGQKQRISIARALIREPRILLLDEATNSLDSQSENTVQDALNKASLGRTTIIIAHRLSALRDADLIAVIQSGQVVESGSHDQLIKTINGPYSAMVKLQNTLIKDETTPSYEEIETEVSLSQNREAHLAETTREFVTTLTSIDQARKEAEGEEAMPSLWHLLRMTASEWKSTLLGCIGALCYGLIQPLHSFCLGAALSVYFISDPEEIRSEIRKYVFAWLSFSVFAFFSNVVQHYYFGVMGEHLTKKIREIIFGKILSFEIAWFDQENNNTGALCSRLSTDAMMVRTLVADRVAFFTQSISAATLAVILSMVLSWKLALVAIAMQPLIIGAFYLRAVMIRTMSKKILKAQNNSSVLASEAVGNHRVIAAFYSHEKVMALFEDTQKEPKNESHKQSWYAGLGLFTSQFLTAANAGLLFWYGGKLLYKEDITYKELFQTFFILVGTGRVIAETGSMTADLSKGMNALKSIFIILNRRSMMEPNEQDVIIPVKIEGHIELKEVDFFYPTRPKQMVLTSLSLKIDAGEVVALVGQSGSGKSTIVRMIERFYDPSKGVVEVDGVDIRCYNLRALRSHIAWVGQGPTLFAGTIHENIVYGKENATEAEIIEAATLANAHEFICSMIEGYGTYCGERGMQLSGGQKQRLALARAILKNPSILLLDEATSALDTKSEKLVQDALEKVMIGRTCLIVAHRLSTIQKAKKISVVDNGRIVEEGSHDELLAKGEKSAYFSLVTLQQAATMKFTEISAG